MSSECLLTIPVGGNQYIDVDLTRLFAPPVPNEEAIDFEFLLQVLGDERPPPKYWLRVASYCAANGHAIEAEVVAKRAIDLFARPSRPGTLPEAEVVAIYNLLASLAVAQAREAPTCRLPDARFTALGSAPLRSALLQESDSLLRTADSIAQYGRHPPPGLMDKFAYVRELTKLSRGVLALARGMDVPAMNEFEAVLARSPYHIVALLGKGCLLLRRKKYTEALAVYQTALHVHLFQTLTGPDPRIGIGLAFWGLGVYDEARRAWRRSLAVNKANHSALTLLGLSSLYLFKSSAPLLPEGSDEDAFRCEYYAEGIQLLSQAFQLNDRTAITAVALAEHFISKATVVITSGLLFDSSDQNWPIVRDMLNRALTLGEQAIQYADASRSTIQAKLQHARALHIMSYVPGGEIALRTIAQRFYHSVLEDCTRLTLQRSSGAAVGTVADKHIPAPEALAAIGLAQIQISTGSSSSAKETLLKYTAKAMTGGSSGIEVLLLAAALRARQNSSDEPRQMLERALKVIEAAQEQVEGGETKRIAGQGPMFSTSGDAAHVPWKGERLYPGALRAIAHLGEQDPYIYIDLAQMIQTQDASLAGRAYASALRILNERGLGPRDQILAYRVRANLAATVALGVQLSDAEENTRADAFAAAVGETEGVLDHVTDKDDPIRVVAQYNLARTYELAGRSTEARSAYEELLASHPEYVDAKIRLALMYSGHATDREERDQAYTLFRESIASAPANLDARLAYAVFLAGELPGSPSSVNWPNLRDFLAEPLKPPDMGAATFGSKSAAADVQAKARKDAASLAVLGWSYYQTVLAQRNKPPPGQPPEQAKAERTKGLFRAIDLFDRALAVDPKCAFAAQGIAILLSEDVFEITERGAAALEERYRRNADEAISILSKVREVRNDASVHICIGHALMRKKEYFRAIKSYELAESLYHPQGPTLASLLQSLARAEYAEGLSVRSPAHLARAIGHLVRAQRVLKGTNTSGAALEARWVSYNEAVLRQRLLALLHDVGPPYRSAAEIREATDGMQAAVDTLGGLSALASARQLSHITPDVVDQRIKFATATLLPQARADLEQQLAFEAQEATKLQAAEETRAARQRLLEQQQREAEEERQRRAEDLARRREQAKEQLNEKLDWSVLEAVGQDKKVSRPKREKAPKKSRRARRGAEDDGALSDGSDLFDSAGSDQDAEGDAEGGGEGAAEARRQRKANAALERIKKSKKGKARGKGRGKRRSRKVVSDESGEDDDNPPDLHDDESDSSASEPDARPKKRPRKSQVMEDDDLIDSDEEV